ncbi:MAG: DUF1549 and DUF1553 domain-containing protein [Blastocatellia bacterium]|nr:DUF1549 and DUF1553 domain-containing protein [Blastocatellia bacterium]
MQKTNRYVKALFLAFVVVAAGQAQDAAPKNEYLLRPEHRSHWSFQPVRPQPVPAVRGRANNPIDNFLLARLEAAGFTFNPQADKYTLIRRATYDLTGLPPTPEEIEAFLADRSPEAFAKVVDRLLASSHYGERWGRHWLDVARYADSEGLATTDGGIASWFPYAHSYRDWVIRAFNEDLPYDQFLLHQIAADRVPENDPRNLAALGFLTLRRGAADITTEDKIDDQIDVVSRGLMGLTVSCARCHNHKFDPIPTRDYYSLFSVFANSRAPKTLPLLDPKASGGEKEKTLQTEIARIEEEIAKKRETRFPELLTGYRAADEVAKCLLSAHDARDLKKEPQLVALAQEKDYNLFLMKRWRDYLLRAGEDDIWTIWHRLSAIPAGEFAARAASTLTAATADPARRIHPLVAKEFAAPPASMREVAERYGRLLAGFDKPEKLADPAEEALRLVLRGAEAPTSVAFRDFDEIQHIADLQFEFGRRQTIEKLRITYAYDDAPPRAMALEDDPELKPGHVLVRGNPNNKGEQVERQFLQILEGESRRPFTNGSGRLELARAVADSRNPLTARVLVNRVWQRHFGNGIVRTPSDFGLRGDAPTHPELLDFLAARFVASGWSIKSLHRLVLLSRAWQQSSANNEAASKADPENRLLWRMNRRRLDYEELRDSLLVAGGNLDFKMGGLPQNAAAWPFMRRRTVYSFIDRVALPNDYQIFNFAGPEFHSPQRHLTTVPQQALFWMNSPFAMEQAQAVMKRPEIAALSHPRERIHKLYRALYGRAPSEEELALGLRFVAGAASEPEAAAPDDKSGDWQYGQGEFDEAAKKTKDFLRHEYFLGGHWRATPLISDPRLVSVRLTEQGGRPEGRSKAVIRRWIAPFDGEVSISGVLENEYELPCGGCDGVQGTLVSSRAGVLGTWTANLSKAETRVPTLAVKKDDAIDFIVDGRKNGGSDDFKWNVTIKRTDGSAEEWNSVRDFRRPARRPLNVWERYAQALLAAVEFVLLD